MKEKIKNIIGGTGFIVFLMCASGIDVTEHLFIQTLVAFAGLFAFYIAGKDYEYEYEYEYDDEEDEIND